MMMMMMMIFSIVREFNEGCHRRGRGSDSVLLAVKMELDKVFFWVLRSFPNNYHSKFSHYY
jgi:hypothetical protein